MGDRGSYAKGRARREELLKSVINVLKGTGYSGATIRGLAREVGVEAPRLIYYFDSREKLIENVLHEWSSRRAGDGPADGRVGRVSVFNTWPAALREDRQMRGLVHLYIGFAAEAADPSHPSHAYFMERFERLRSRIVSAVTEGQQIGELRSDLIPDEVATDLIALSDGLNLQWLINPAIDPAARLQAAIDELRRNPARQPPQGHPADTQRPGNAENV